MPITREQLTEMERRVAQSKRNSRFQLTSGAPVNTSAAAAVFEEIARACDMRKPKKRVRQSAKKLTTLEEEWGAVLRSRYIVKLHAQAKTYRLGNGVRYTPDWTAVTADGEIAWEVKGKKAWDDAIVKIKMAPTIWPEVTWWLVWKDESGQWQEQRILE